MYIKKYLPSSGFIFLIFIIIISIQYVQWIFSPLDYEKAMYEENKGHKLSKQGKYKEASKHFLRAANYYDNNISKSNRYLWTASTIVNRQDKEKYYKLSLKYNPNNKISSRRLNNLLRQEDYE